MLLCDHFTRKKDASTLRFWNWEVMKSLPHLPCTSIFEEIIEKSILMHSRVLHVLSPITYFCDTSHLSWKSGDKGKTHVCSPQMKTSYRNTSKNTVQTLTCELGEAPAAACPVGCFVNKRIKHTDTSDRTLLIMNPGQRVQTRPSRADGP